MQPPDVPSLGSPFFPFFPTCLKLAESIGIRGISSRMRIFKLISLQRFCTDFGHSSGKTITRIIVEELGGMRITFPDLKDIYSECRNRKICNLFNGANHKELAIMFDLTEGRIKDIVTRRG